MVSHIDCIAAIESNSLADAFEKQMGHRVQVIRSRFSAAVRERPGTDRTTILLWESGISLSFMAGTTGPRICFLLAVSKDSGCLPTPPGVTGVLYGKTIRQLIDASKQQLRLLEQTASQRMVRWQRVDARRMDVLFLDDEVYSLPLDNACRWEEAVISPDMRYLVVRDQHSKIKTVPWDAIRQPKNHLDEDVKTRRKLAGMLVRFRKSAGLSQLQAGKKSGISRMSLHRLEKGEQYPTIQTLRVLAKAYRIKIDDLLKTMQRR